MKRCPTCSRTFENTLTYCLIDGSVLSAPFTGPGESGEATQVLPSNEGVNAATDNTASTPPAPTMTARYQPAGTPRFEPPATNTAGQKKPYLLVAVVVLTAVFLVIGISLLLVINRGQFSYSADTAFVFLRRSPLFLIAAVGALLSLVRIRHHPRASLLTMLAMVVLAFATLFFTLLIRWLTRNMSAAESNWVYDVARVIQDFIVAGETILFVAAAYSERQPFRALTSEGT
jgi:hypothetical protein